MAKKKKKATSRASTKKKKTAIKPKKPKKKPQTVMFTSKTPPPKPASPIHAADKVDIDAISLEELMQLAAHECSCRRLQRAQGIKDPTCSGDCTHAKAVAALGGRGIVA